MLKTILHNILALALFTGSVGITINKHYCQYELVKTSFLRGSDQCCMGKISHTCPTEKMSCTKKEQQDENDCCKNKSKYYKLDQTQDIEQIEVKSINKKVTLNAIIPVYNAALKSSDKYSIQYLNYSPPLIFFDRQVRLQTFLC